MRLISQAAFRILQYRKTSSVTDSVSTQGRRRPPQELSLLNECPPLPLSEIPRPPKPKLILRYFAGPSWRLMRTCRRSHQRVCCVFLASSSHTQRPSDSLFRHRAPLCQFPCSYLYGSINEFLRGLLPESSRRKAPRSEGHSNCSTMPLLCIDHSCNPTADQMAMAKTFRS